MTNTLTKWRRELNPKFDNAQEHQSTLHKLDKTGYQQPPATKE
jgi:hypothetical protein